MAKKCAQRGAQQQVDADLDWLHTAYTHLMESHLELMGIETLLKGAMLNLVALVDVAVQDDPPEARQRLGAEIVWRVTEALKANERQE